MAAGALAVAERPLASLARASERRVFPDRVACPLLETRLLPPVKVARNRIIRTVVGLRPFRDEGFVVNGERLGDKLLVHNYGHGGAGVTLSWGTSSLAVDIARDFAQTRPLLTRRQRNASRRAPLRFAVLGCGVIGLSTARLLQRRLQGEGTTVTIYAKDLPPQTTSNIAGAWWSPTSLFESQMTSAKFMEQYRLSKQISYRAFQELVGPEYGVSWMDGYEFITSEASLSRELSGGTQFYPQTEIHRAPDQFFGFPYTRHFNSMLIEPHTYLRSLMRDFYVAGGRVVVREFKKREEIAKLPEQVVFNCTGLGARDLFGDLKLGPVRGQLEVLLPQPEIDYCYISAFGYMFPRRDGIVLGGTFDRGDWSLTPNPEQTTRILEGHATIMSEVKKEHP